MTWKAVVVGWLLSSINIRIETLCKAIEGMDVNQDGSLDLGELVKGVMRLVRR